MKKINNSLLYLLLLLGLSKPLQGFSQEVAAMDSIYKLAISYADMDEDSMLFFNNELTKKYSQEKNYPIYNYRILGIYFDNNFETDSATFYFMKAIDISERLNNKEASSALYSDIGYLYLKNKAYSNAKTYYAKALAMSISIQKKPRIASCYNSIGHIFQNQGVYDSALVYYEKSLAIKKELQDTQGILDINNNIGSLYGDKGMPEKALPYFKTNLELRIANQVSRKLLFNDYTNLAASYMRLHNFISFKQYADSAAVINKEFQSTDNDLALKNVWVCYYEEIADYKNAFLRLRELNMLEDSLMNIESINTTTNLMEKYNATKRESDNKLLASELKQQKLLKRIWLFAFISLLILLSLLIFFLKQRNKKNRLLEEKNQEITKQNKMLAELNYEKNSLISIVSHDLGSPFANIKLWNSVLASNTDGLDEEKLKAIQRISQAVDNGELMIKQILDVERLFAKENHQLVLERINLIALLQNIITEFDIKSRSKKITIHSLFPTEPIILLTDKNYFIRIVENIISNSLKYTMQGKNIYVNVQKEKNKLVLTIEDEGIGIAEEYLPLIFSKYGNINNRPTAGEQSTGLGLSIVKRLADELGVQIEAQSVKGKGTKMQLYFPNN